MRWAQSAGIYGQRNCCTSVTEVRVEMIHGLLTGVRRLLEGEYPYNLVC